MSVCGVGNFGAPPKPAVFRVEVGLQIAKGPRYDLLRALFPLPGSCRHGEEDRHFICCSQEFLPSLLPRGIDHRDEIEHPDQPEPRFPGDIGGGEERSLVRGHDDGEGPAPGAHELERNSHVNVVYFRPLLPVELDVHEARVHESRHPRVLEGFAGHDMAPVARGVADGEEDRLVFCVRPAEGLLAPGIPVDRVVGMLEKVGTLLMDESVWFPSGHSTPFLPLNGGYDKPSGGNIPLHAPESVHHPYTPRERYLNGKKGDTTWYNAMIHELFQFRETIATILAVEPPHIAAAKAGMMAARQELERYIARDPFFAITYDPYTPVDGGRVVTRMADAARKAGVGPMAAVAGAIAWSGLEAMIGAGAVFGVIDNGGDIALLTDRTIRVGIHAGSSPSLRYPRIRHPARDRDTGDLYLFSHGWAIGKPGGRGCGNRLLWERCVSRCVGNSHLQRAATGRSYGSPAPCRE